MFVSLVCFRGTKGQDPKITFFLTFVITNSFVTSVQVILEPYYCSFCGLANDMLNRHIFLEDTCTNMKVTQTKQKNIYIYAPPAVIPTYAWITKHQNWSVPRSAEICTIGFTCCLKVIGSVRIKTNDFEACPAPYSTMQTLVSLVTTS